MADLKPFLVRFLEESYPAHSYFAALQTFMRGKETALSERTLERIYYNLHPIGDAIQNAPIQSLTHRWLKKYIDKCWLRYAPETMRTLVGDVREFFRWCQSEKYLAENIAMTIKLPKRRHRRRRRAKAAPESDIKRVMECLAGEIRTAVYRDLFGNLQPADPEHWTYETTKALRDLFILTFLYETGARAGELSKLGSLAMDEATKEAAPAYLITVIGKEHDRDYLFTPKTAELWRVWQRERPAECREYAVIGWGNSHPPGQLLPNGLSHMLVRRCRQAGVQPFRTHSLRHAKIKRSRRLVGLEMASLLVDHSDIETTRGYDSDEEEKLAEAAILTGLQFDIV